MKKSAKKRPARPGKTLQRPATRNAGERISRIRALRVLPPMAIARFGSSSEPMDNYRLELPPDDDPAAFRRILPAETLVIGDDGSITEIRFPDRTAVLDPGKAPDIRKIKQPRTVSFRDTTLEKKIKPVCPFLEVWAQFDEDGPFQPLTLHHLEALGLQPDDVKWSATATNSKAWRRTGQEEDNVRAATGIFSDHKLHELRGESDNFKPNKFISFGHVRYIRPTTSPDPEIDQITSCIRARFTPGKGLVFGPRANDPFTSGGDVYWARTAGGPNTANWDRYFPGDEDNAMPVTAPQDIFQGWMMGLSDDDETWNKLSAGYFDDTCDGIITVAIRHRDKKHAAYARFASAVPDFAPDSLPVRSIADDLEQLVLGPVMERPANNNPQAQAEFKTKLIDILRRSLETVRQMNTAVANGTEGLGDVKKNWQSMSRRLHTNYEAEYSEVFPPDPDFHPDSARQMFSHANALIMHAHQLRKAINDGRTTAFYVMRMPEDAGDVWPTSRMQMPAFMRGSEGFEICLTRRQLSVLAIAAGEKPEVVLSRAGRNAARAAAGFGPHARATRAKTK
jgi:hypothetical protein